MAEPRATKEQRVPVVGLLITGVLTLVVIQVLLPFAWTNIGLQGNAKLMDAKNSASQLLLALKHYRTEYGGFPPGDHIQIISALRGDNPLKIVFFEAGADRFSTKGELLDPWKTPFSIGSHDDGKPWVYSCGPNRVDEGGLEGSDDIRSWR